MKTIFTLRTGLLFAFIFTLTAQVFAQTQGDYRTAAGTGGNTNTKTHWQVYQGGSWIIAPTSPATTNIYSAQLCTFSSGATSLSFSGVDTSFNAIRTNQFVSDATTISSGTKVTSVTPETSVTISKATIAAASGATPPQFREQLGIACSGSLGSPTLTFTSPLNTDALSAGMCVTNANIPAGTTILSVISTTKVTLSANATATVTTANFNTRETTAAKTAGSNTITLAATIV